ncbi:MAG: T9SS type A sorting domain-containing protein, partial [Bacteroidales bacterium]
LSLVNGKWEVTLRDTSIYDEKGRLSQYINMPYSFELEKLTPKYREIYVYDDSNRVIEKAHDSYNPNSEEWKIGSKADYVYDSLGRTLSETTSDWVADLDKYIPYFKLNNRDFNKYNKPLYAEGFKFLSSETGYGDDTWMDFTWDTMNYDPQGNLLRTHRYMFTFGSIKPVEANTWRYNDKNKEIEHIYFRAFLDTTLADPWAPWQKTTTLYLENGCIDYSSNSKATSPTTWSLLTRLQYYWSEFDRPADQFDVSVSQIIDPNSSTQWSNAEKVTLEVKNLGTSAVNTIPVVCKINNIQLSGTIVEELAPGGSVQYTFEQKVDLSKLSTYTLTAYTKLQTDTYRKNDTCRKIIQKLAIDQTDKVSVQIYPNPVRTQLNIKSTSAIKQITIYTLSGQIVLQEEGQNQEMQSISVTSLAQGLYILQIQTQNGLEKKKISLVK